MELSEHEMRKLAKRVERGSQLLSAIMPKWYEQIDVNRLHMRIEGDCILSQIWGSQDEAETVLFSACLGPDKVVESVVFGFYIDPKDCKSPEHLAQTNFELGQLWKQKIKKLSPALV